MKRVDQEISFPKQKLSKDGQSIAQDFQKQLIHLAATELRNLTKEKKGIKRLAWTEENKKYFDKIAFDVYRHSADMSHWQLVQDGDSQFIVAISEPLKETVESKQEPIKEVQGDWTVEGGGKDLVLSYKGIPAQVFNLEGFEYPELMAQTIIKNVNDPHFLRGFFHEISPKVAKALERVYDGPKTLKASLIKTASLKRTAQELEAEIEKWGYEEGKAFSIPSGQTVEEITEVVGENIIDEVDEWERVKSKLMDYAADFAEGPEGMADAVNYAMDEFFRGFKRALKEKGVVEGSLKRTAIDMEEPSGRYKKLIPSLTKEWLEMIKESADNAEVPPMEYPSSISSIVNWLYDREVVAEDNPDPILNWIAKQIGENLKQKGYKVKGSLKRIAKGPIPLFGNETKRIANELSQGIQEGQKVSEDSIINAIKANEDVLHKAYIGDWNIQSLNDLMLVAGGEIEEDLKEKGIQLGVTGSLKTAQEPPAPPPMPGDPKGKEKLPPRPSEKEVEEAKNLYLDLYNFSKEIQAKMAEYSAQLNEHYNIKGLRENEKKAIDILMREIKNNERNQVQMGKQFIRVVKNTTGGSFSRPLFRDEMFKRYKIIQDDLETIMKSTVTPKKEIEGIKVFEEASLNSQSLTKVAGFLDWAKSAWNWIKNIGTKQEEISESLSELEQLATGGEEVAASLKKSKHGSQVNL